MFYISIASSINYELMSVFSIIFGNEIIRSIKGASINVTKTNETL